MTRPNISDDAPTYAKENELTVVIPFWDLPDAMLQRALVSVANHAPPSTEVIVVDNASRIKPNFEGRVVTLTERVTVGEARNAALTLIQTPFCLFLDADDELMPRAVDDLLDRATHHRLDLAGGSMVGRRQGDHLLFRWGYPPAWAYRICSTKLLGLINVYRNVLPAVGAAVLRTSKVMEVGGFGSSNRGEDWSLSSVVGLMGRAGLFDIVALRIEVRPTSLSTKDESRAAARRTRSDVRRRVGTTGWRGRLLSLTALPVHEYTAWRRSRRRHAGDSGRP